MKIYLNIGGLVAAGFDNSGEYLLTVSHSGRGVFSTKTWSKVARDTELAYPVAGCAIGIGPISGQSVPIVEKNYQTDQLRFVSPDGLFNLFYEYGTLEISECAQIGAAKMRYVPQHFLESTLRRGKSLEQFVGGGSRDGERVISHLELRPTPDGIEIWRFVVPDIGSSEFLDLYDFGGEEDEELVCVVASAPDAFSYAHSSLGALCDRWVNEGVTQDEYADFIAAGRPLRWPIVSA